MTQYNPRTPAILAAARDNHLELELETVTSSSEASDAYRKLNPLAKIPTFVGADGYVVYECIAVAIYGKLALGAINGTRSCCGCAVTSQNPATTLLGADKQQYASIVQWMSFANSAILPALGDWFNPLIGRQAFVLAHVERAKEATLQALQVLEEHLRCANAGFLVGDRLSLADLFVVGVVAGAFRCFLDRSWREAHPACTAWFTTVHALPIYSQVAGCPMLAEIEMPITAPGPSHES